MAVQVSARVCAPTLRADDFSNRRDERHGAHPVGEFVELVGVEFPKRGRKGRCLHLGQFVEIGNQIVARF